MSKPILVLDFDGVCHSYTSGWKDATVIPDPPVPGLFEFLEQAQQFFDIAVFSSRSHQPGGRDAMITWFSTQYRIWQGPNHDKGPEVLNIQFPMEKPSAFISIDDRAITFDGTWPSVEFLQAFKPWNKK